MVIIIHLSAPPAPSNLIDWYFFAATLSILLPMVAPAATPPVPPTTAPTPRPTTAPIAVPMPPTIIPSLYFNAPNLLDDAFWSCSPAFFVSSMVFSTFRSVSSSRASCYCTIRACSLDIWLTLRIMDWIFYIYSWVIVSAESSGWNSATAKMARESSLFDFIAL